MTVYICTKFHEHILDNMKVIQRTRLSPIGKISKGHNSVLNVGGVSVLFCAHRLTAVYICTKFHENILDAIKVI